MHLKKLGGWSVVLSLSLVVGPFGKAFAEEELPPPPPMEEEAMPAIEPDVSAGAELPPPPEMEEVPMEEPPAITAEAPELPEAPLDEDIPPVPIEELAAPSELPEETFEEVPSDVMAPEEPPKIVEAPMPSQYSTSTRFEDLSMEDKLKSKELVLWLSLGGSYGSLDTKGTYRAATTDTMGGVGYAASFGMRVSGAFQAQLDVFGIPRTERQTVDMVTLGFGPRLGFISLMALLGVQSGADLTVADRPPRTNLFSYGVKGGLDLVLGHIDNSRVSVGLAPEVFYVTSQGNNGYTSMGGSVSLRFYGYENAF